MFEHVTPPEQPVANLQYRKAIRRWAVKDPRNVDMINKRCKDDFFFFIKTFGWLYEPRPDVVDGVAKSPILPFIPWAHQVPVMEDIIKHLGFRDIGIEKARGEGATYTCINILLWRWLFTPLQSFALVSRSHEFADSPSQPDSLGAKVDWAIGKLPAWMIGKKGVDWERNIQRHTWVRFFRKGDDVMPDTSTMGAYATTGDLGAGGRKTAIFMDELGRFPRGDDDKAMSASEPVTNCRLLVSTYSGADGAYYKAMKNPKSMVKLYLKWEDNPARNVGMFCIDSRGEKLVDPETRTPVHTEDGYAEKFFREYFPILRTHGFNVDSKTKIWSPWYVDRCMREGMTPQWIAQEYDRDPAGSSATFFSGPLIEALLERTQPPLFEGDVFIKDELVVKRILKRKGGQFRLWLPHTGSNVWVPPLGNYVIGVDVAAGTGASHSSNSVASIVDADTGRKVGEFASPSTSPENFAEICVALCRLFKDIKGGPAYLGWECNGPGTQFREHILGTSFRHFYYRIPTKSAKRKRTREPGWWSTKDAKREVLGGYRWALAEGYFYNPSREALHECLRYHVVSGGRIEFIADGEDQNLNEAGEAHGDRVIADAIANMLMEEKCGGRKSTVRDKMLKKAALNPPAGSFLHRRLEARKKKQDKDWW